MVQVTEVSVLSVQVWVLI